MHANIQDVTSLPVKLGSNTIIEIGLTLQSNVDETNFFFFFAHFLHMSAIKHFLVVLCLFHIFILFTCIYLCIHLFMRIPHLLFSLHMSLTLQIPQDLNSADPSKAQQQIITCLTVSPSEETLVASTDLSQLYSITLSSADIGKVSEGVKQN